MGSEVADVTQVLSNTSVKVFFGNQNGGRGHLPPTPNFCFWSYRPSLPPPTPPSKSVKELFRSLNWHKLEQQRKLYFSFFLYKDLNNETPEYLSSEFITGMDVTPCN